MSVIRPSMPSPGGKFVAGLSTLILCVFFAFPLYWMIKGSLEPTGNLLQPSLVPSNSTAGNYRDLFDGTEFGSYLFNSIVVALGSTALTVVVASFAGYGLARFRFRGKKLIARGILFTYMLPGLALAIPLFLVFRGMQLTNSLLGLTLAHSSLSLPFGIWLMWQFFQTVPRSYQESAFSLGAGRLRTFFEIEVPLASPGMIAVAIFAFALSWEDFEYAFILTTDAAAQTLPVGIMSFVQTQVIHWGLINSAGVFMAIPPLLIVLFLQRYLVKGLGSGGLKG